MVSTVYKQYTAEEVRTMTPYEAGRACARSGHTFERVSTMFEQFFTKHTNEFVKGWNDESYQIVLDKMDLFIADPEAYKAQLNRELNDLGTGVHY